MCKRRLSLVAFAGIAFATPCLAAGDFPLASCASWNGTIISFSGLDTSEAEMSGRITTFDVEDYCRRDPGGETIRYGDGLSFKDCVRRYVASLWSTKLSARADCERGVIELDNGDNPHRVQLPVEDASCASGNGPLIQQFALLCPGYAARFTGGASVGWFLAELPGQFIALIYGSTDIDSRGEGVQLSLYCRRRSGVVNISGPEVGRAFRPGRRVIAHFSAGGTKASVMGDVVWNAMNDAGQLKTTLPATHPIFLAINNAYTLSIRIGRWRTAIPLDGTFGKALLFIRRCAR